MPLTRTHMFLAGHEYVAYYVEHLRAVPQHEPEVVTAKEMKRSRHISI